jgi:hypothetical protein
MPKPAKEGSPVHAVITKIDRMKTRQGDSLFLKVDVGGETVRVFGCPEELAEHLEAREGRSHSESPVLVKKARKSRGSPVWPVLPVLGVPTQAGTPILRQFLDMRSLFPFAHL